MPFAIVLLLALIVNGCAPKPAGQTLHVAAAANLTRVFPKLARACEAANGIHLLPSFGATAQLAQQIENGGPFDLFLAADTQHVDTLAAKGLAVAGSRRVYARGKLVLWAPHRNDLSSPSDLASPKVRAVGIAKPDLAPYGKASVETLQSLHLWPQVEKKVVYAPNINSVKQFADSSNVDAAFTALALVVDEGGHRIEIDPSLHAPIDQAMCVLSAPGHADLARRAEDFLLGADARAIFVKAGYGAH